jgi:hypothetical protein
MQLVAGASHTTQVLANLCSLCHAMVMAHPYNPGTALIDYSTMAILTPAMLVGIKAGARLC